MKEASAEVSDAVEQSKEARQDVRLGVPTPLRAAQSFLEVQTPS